MHEAEQAISEGADEIDIVIDIGALKEGRIDIVQGELQTIRQATTGTTLKVIIEACLLARDEKVAACNICTFVGADFVKTSTGYSSGGANVADVALLRDIVGSEIGVKASGGIRTRTMALAMLAAGASRIGTSVGPALLAPAETGNFVI
ncbi:MAG: deoC [Rhizobium sp.]|nr:deoC [Rhizobium sp.]